MSNGRINLGGRRFKILVTDDEASVRRSLQLMLHANGFEAHSYSSGSALLADTEAKSADCIIADYSMPDIDGLSLLAGLRSAGWNKPAILITAFGSNDLTERAKAFGYTDVITKPFIRRPILDALKRYCSARNPETAPQRQPPPKCGC
jgi:FixJ family two-component response regulator